MRIEYVGSLARVRLPIPDQRPQECDRGEAIDVPDDFGRDLIAQQPMNWQEAGRQPSLEELTVAQLQSIAAERNIATAGLKKAELIEAIRGGTPSNDDASGETKDGE